MKKRLDSSRELMKVCFSCHLDMTIFSVLLTFFSASLPHFGHWRLKTCFDFVDIRSKQKHDGSHV